MSTWAWLLVAIFFALAALAWSVGHDISWPYLVILGLLAASGCVWWVDRYVKQPTGVPTAPESLRCVGCRQRDRKIKWRNLWLMAASVAIFAACYGGPHCQVGPRDPARRQCA